MSHQTNQIISQLAEPIKDEFTDRVPSTAPAALKAAIEKAAQKRAEQRAEQLSEVLGDVMDSHESNVTASVERIRHYRRMAAAEKERLEKQERAYLYGMNTGNFVPFKVSISDTYGIDYNIIQKFGEIPKDWEPEQD